MFIVCVEKCWFSVHVLEWADAKDLADGTTATTSLNGKPFRRFFVTEIASPTW